MNVVSLFAGIGGFDLGFERAGMKTVAQVEYDKHASSVLARHYPDVIRYEDIRDVKGQDLPATDVICGGSPCQDLSVAGKRGGLVGEKSQLFWEYHRIVDEVRPEWLVWENVPGALSSNEGRDFAHVIFSLGELGYKLAWRVLDSQYCGVPQRRRRLFVVGHLRDGRAAQVLFERESVPGSSQSRPPAGQTVARTFANSTGNSRKPGMQSAVYRMRGHGDYASDTVASTVKSRDHKDATDLIVFDASASDKFSLKDSTTTAFTLQASQGGLKNPCVAQGHIVRRLTPTECERLQGFPQGWTDGQSDTHRYKQLGNAVTVNVAEWIGKQIIKVAQINTSERAA